jgi:cell division cycle 14
MSNIEYVAPFQIIKGYLYLANSYIVKSDWPNPCQTFTAENELAYTPFCDDFGPMNLDQTFRFYQLVEDRRAAYPTKSLILCVASDARNMTNAIFLLGTYLILSRRLSPQSIWEIFRPLSPHIEFYRDATLSEASFRLTLLDCWGGFARAIALGWLEEIDLDEYAHYDNPLEGDLHWTVPGKLIAFKGPRSLPDDALYADRDGYRVFSPRFYTEAPFADMGVAAVVRLNELEYDPADFERAGIACVDLEFDDCTAPPPHVVAEFLHTVDRAAGPVAVHCKAGLGRTGTLIAAHMMARCGFTAREAMGWLRIVRPGSVIGEQQAFLCHLEAAGCDCLAAAAAASAAAAAAAAAAGCAAQAQQLAEQVAAALQSPERTAGRAAKATAGAH